MSVSNRRGVAAGATWASFMKDVTMDPNLWFVTARFVDTRHPLGRQPFGTSHARRSGSDYTACGEVAVGWPMFWHLAFADAEASAACRACAEILSAPLRRRQIAV